jgi:hypothetical protein
MGVQRAGRGERGRRHLAADVTQSPVDNSQFVPSSARPAKTSPARAAPSPIMLRPTPVTGRAPTPPRTTIPTRRGGGRSRSFRRSPQPTGPSSAPGDRSPPAPPRCRSWNAPSRSAPRRLYERRKTIVEHAFGMIKSARGIDRFRRRGTDAAPPRMATRRYHSQPAQDLAPPARDRLRSTKHRPITPTTIPAADNPAQASNDTPPEPKRNRIYRCEPGTSLCEA